MQFNSLEPFIPSGSDFEASKKLFLELGFEINWGADDYIGFQKDATKFILQKFDNKTFAENLMLSVVVSDLENYWQHLSHKNLPEKFGVKLGKITDYPWGTEFHFIDIAGVCWHFRK